jgi:hypothetical protein
MAANDTAEGLRRTTRASGRWGRRRAMRTDGAPLPADDPPPTPPPFRAGRGLRRGALLSLFADTAVARRAAA